MGNTQEARTLCIAVYDAHSAHTSLTALHHLITYNGHNVITHIQAHMLHNAHTGTHTLGYTSGSIMADTSTHVAQTHTQGHTHWGIHQAALWLVEQEGLRISGTQCICVRISGTQCICVRISNTRCKCVRVAGALCKEE